MADDTAVVNPSEIAANLNRYACLPRSRGSKRGHAELMGARLIEAQQAEIERLRAAGDALAENYAAQLLGDNWSAFNAAFHAAWQEARRAPSITDWTDMEWNAMHQGCPPEFLRGEARRD